MVPPSCFLCTPFVIENHTFHLTCSIGVSMYPYDGLLAEELLNSAGAAMYQEKIAGATISGFISLPPHDRNFANNAWSVF